MENFSQFVERADHPQGDFEGKTAALQTAWKQLELLVQKYHQIIAPLQEIAPEVVPDLSQAVEQAINGDRLLSNRDYNYLLQIIVGHNRFDKSTYLKDWPKKQPDWWTGNPWNKS
jgi:hypothetical protein